MEEIHVEVEEEVEKLLQCLPKRSRKGDNAQMVKYQDFWYFTDRNLLRNVITFQKHFVAQDSDIIITSIPKTGSTWLKSLLFSIVNRSNHPIDQSPLLNSHPQELVYSLETDVYGEAFSYPRPHHLNELKSPRLLSTHLPNTSLPESINTSKCRILYICRNPFDTFVSSYYFIQELLNNLNNDQLAAAATPRRRRSLEDTFEDFCNGEIVFGPFFEHVIGYWKISLEQPDKVLFLKYEDLKDDETHQLKRVAEFIGMPFSAEEESEGVVKQIIELCSIKSMKEVNKSGVINKFFEKKSYFRKGEVGDWTNHFTPAMLEKMNKLMEFKLQGIGLSFKMLP